MVDISDDEDEDRSIPAQPYWSAIAGKREEDGSGDSAEEEEEEGEDELEWEGGEDGEEGEEEDIGSNDSAEEGGGEDEEEGYSDSDEHDDAGAAKRKAGDAADNDFASHSSEDGEDDTKSVSDGDELTVDEATARKEAEAAAATNNNNSRVDYSPASFLTYDLPTAFLPSSTTDTRFVLCVKASPSPMCHNFDVTIAENKTSIPTHWCMLQEVPEKQGEKPGTYRFVGFLHTDAPFDGTHRGFRSVESPTTKPLVETKPLSDECIELVDATPVTCDAYAFQLKSARVYGGLDLPLDAMLANVTAFFHERAFDDAYHRLHPDPKPGKPKGPSSSSPTTTTTAPTTEEVAPDDGDGGDEDADDESASAPAAQATEEEPKTKRGRGRPRKAEATTANKARKTEVITDSGDCLPTFFNRDQSTFVLPVNVESSEQTGAPLVRVTNVEVHPDLKIPIKLSLVYVGADTATAEVWCNRAEFAAMVGVDEGLRYASAPSVSRSKFYTRMLGAVPCLMFIKGRRLVALSAAHSPSMYAVKAATDGLVAFRAPSIQSSMVGNHSKVSGPMFGYDVDMLDRLLPEEECSNGERRILAAAIVSKAHTQELEIVVSMSMLTEQVVHLSKEHKFAELTCGRYADSKIDDYVFSCQSTILSKQAVATLCKEVDDARAFQSRDEFLKATVDEYKDLQYKHKMAPRDSFQDERVSEEERYRELCALRFKVVLACLLDLPEGFEPYRSILKDRQNTLLRTLPVGVRRRAVIGSPSTAMEGCNDDEAPLSVACQDYFSPFENEPLLTLPIPSRRDPAFKRAIRTMCMPNNYYDTFRRLEQYVEDEDPERERAKKEMMYAVTRYEDQCGAYDGPGIVCPVEHLYDQREDALAAACERARSYMYRRGELVYIRVNGVVRIVKTKNLPDLLSGHNLMWIEPVKGGCWRVRKEPFAPAWLKEGDQEGRLDVVNKPPWALTEREKQDCVNMYTPLAAEHMPLPRTLRKMATLLYITLQHWFLIAGCENKHLVFDIKLHAHMVQVPYEPGGVAICYVGDPGAGKSQKCQQMVGMVGSELAFSTSKADLCVGRFNGTLNNLFGVMEEVKYSSTDGGNDGAFLEFLTNPTLQIEKKGLEAETIRNKLHILMATNERPCKDSRRVCIFDSSNLMSRHGHSQSCTCVKCRTAGPYFAHLAKALHRPTTLRSLYEFLKRVIKQRSQLAHADKPTVSRRGAEADRAHDDVLVKFLEQHLELEATRTPPKESDVKEIDRTTLNDEFNAAFPENKMQAHTFGARLNELAHKLDSKGCKGAIKDTKQYKNTMVPCEDGTKKRQRSKMYEFHRRKLFAEWIHPRIMQEQDEKEAWSSRAPDVEDDENMLKRFEAPSRSLTTKECQLIEAIVMEALPCQVTPNPDLDNRLVTKLVQRIMEIMIADGVYDEDGRLTPSFEHTKRNGDVGYSTCARHKDTNIVRDEEVDDDLAPEHWHTPHVDCRQWSSIDQMEEDIAEGRYEGGNGQQQQDGE